MADTVTIAGHKEKTWVVIAVAIGGSIAAYYIWQQHQAASASSSTSGMVTDPTTGVQYPATSTDPTTGLSYGAEIGEYGSVAAADATVQAEDASYLEDAGNLYGTGYYGEDYSTGTYGAVTTTSGSVYTSNSAWAQAVTAGLTDIGYTGTDVATAIGNYLTGTPVTSDMAAIIQAAIAEYGPPPVGSFQIIQQPAGNTSSTTTVAVPNVVGDTLSDAQSAIQAAGLVFSGPSTGTTVATQSPAAGTQVQPGSTVTVTANQPPPAPTTVAVPNVVGDTQAVATTAIQAAGLLVTVAGGSTDPVTAQNPAAGTQVDLGSTVSITLTTYTPPPQQTYTPPPQQTYTPPPTYTAPTPTPTPAPVQSAPAQAYTSGGHVVSVTNNTATVAWTGYNAVRYKQTLNGPGAENGFTNYDTVPQASYSGLEAGHDYTVTIVPYNSAGEAGVVGYINFVTTG